MKIFIYAIYFPTSNKYYVGQTQNLEARMNAHFRSGSLVCRSLYKYDNWQVTILHTCKTRDEANLLEIEDIRNLNCVAPNGYNLTAGGEGGDTFTNNPNKEETKAKMKEAFNRPEEKARRSETAKGNQNAKGKRSAEACANIKEALNRPEVKEKQKGNQNAKGYKRSAETIEKHRQAIKGKHWKCSAEACANMKEAFNRPEVKAKKRKPKSAEARKNMQIAQIKRRIKELEGGD